MCCTDDPKALLLAGTVSAEKLRSKMLAGAAMLSRAVDAVRSVYGDDAVDVIHEAFRKSAADRGAQRASSTRDRSLRAFCSAIDRGCHETHIWVKKENTDDRQAYCFTYCMWADVFRELGAEDVGYWICEGDGIGARAFNSSICFERTQTLMLGDACCNHTFFLGGAPTMDEMKEQGA